MVPKEPEHRIETIRRIAIERLEALGYDKYHDVTTKYLLTGEAFAKSSDEKKLISDIIYLQNKIRILEDMVQELMIEIENEELNKKYPQLDIFGDRVKA